MIRRTANAILSLKTALNIASPSRAFFDVARSARRRQYAPPVPPPWCSTRCPLEPYEQPAHGGSLRKFEDTMTLLSSRVHQVFPGPVAEKFDSLTSLGSVGVAIEFALRRVLLEVGTDDDWSVVCAFSANRGVEAVRVAARALVRDAMVSPPG